jgi:hypothetical protein
MPIADVKRDLEAIAIAEFAAHETKKAELVGDPRAVLVERIGASGNHDDATSKLPVCIGHERLRLPTSVLRHRSWVRSVRLPLTSANLRLTNGSRSASRRATFERILELPKPVADDFAGLGH